MLQIPERAEPSGSIWTRLLKGAMALRRPSASSQQERWVEKVERVIADLEDMNRSTEHEFLAIGGKLMDFLSTAQRISADMTAVADLIAGEQGERASQALAGVLEGARQMQFRADRRDAALGILSDSARLISSTFASFLETISTFRALGTLVRIETARLGTTGLDLEHVAAEVKSLILRVQSEVETVLNAAAWLDQSITSALQAVSDLDTKQLGQLPSVIEEVLGSLGSFHDRQQEARDAASRLSSQSDAVSVAIQDLVMSIQFHDITRQQIEHVVLALQHICSESAPKADAPSAQAAAVLGLQSSQLSAAQQTFAASVQRIDQSLESIAARVHDMTQESSRVSGLAEEEQDSFFLEMERRFSAILKAAGACAAMDGQIGKLAAGLEDSIGQMRQAVAEIGSIELHIQRIALNAGIRAIRIGTAGAPLNIVAEAMQRLTLNSNQRSDDVARALAAMNEAVARISGDPAGMGSPAQQDEAQALDQMRATIEELHSSSERSFSRIKQITAFSARFCDDILTMRSGLSAGRLFAEVVDRSHRTLDSIASQCEDSRSGAAQADLDPFAAHYTMHAERAVHDLVGRGATGSAPAVAPAPEPADPGPDQINDRGNPENPASSATPREPDNLGDNVELF